MGSDHWHISLRPGRQVLQDGMDPLAFINYLSQYGKLLHVETIVDAVPEFAAADPEICYLGFEVALASRASKAEIEGVFDFIREGSQIVIVPPQSQISAYLALIESHHQDAERIGEMLVACGSVTANELAEALAVQKQQEPHAPYRRDPGRTGSGTAAGRRGRRGPAEARRGKAQRRSADRQGSFRSARRTDRPRRRIGHRRRRDTSADQPYPAARYSGSGGKCCYLSSRTFVT
jgi:hypothetical protein